MFSHIKRKRDRIRYCKKERGILFLFNNFTFPSGCENGSWSCNKYLTGKKMSMVSVSFWAQYQFPLGHSNNTSWERVEWTNKELENNLIIFLYCMIVSEIIQEMKCSLWGLTSISVLTGPSQRLTYLLGIGTCISTTCAESEYNLSWP